MADFLDLIAGTTFKFTKDDGNFDEFLKALDVSFLVRKTATTTKPKIEVVKNADGSYTFKTISTFKNSEVTFKLGEEVEEKRMDGKTVKTVFTVEGNKLIQKSDGEPETEFIREFSGDKLIVTCKAGNVVCVREYEKA
ncbi:hypothetical protein GZH46_01006 [Fragariocoptes setiger]|uniref:Lipocalin/cytosolic fatty-acid binding domain-containing protein n=1 Tax=Fragariocoptes setiger TaxID=1670756 RepID=A0ABQ7SAJ2_9ACAR|nr:hypothetical protein GZH46_01006 [Fragariocoptes setiger]